MFDASASIENNDKEWGEWKRGAYESATAAACEIAGDKMSQKGNEKKPGRLAGSASDSVLRSALVNDLADPSKFQTAAPATRRHSSTQRSQASAQRWQCSFSISMGISLDLLLLERLNCALPSSVWINNLSFDAGFPQRVNQLLARHVALRGEQDTD